MNRIEALLRTRRVLLRTAALRLTFGPRMLKLSASVAVASEGRSRVRGARWTDLVGWPAEVERAPTAVASKGRSRACFALNAMAAQPYFGLMAVVTKCRLGVLFPLAVEVSVDPPEKL